jgi:anti-sigma factor RsiW
MSDRSIRCSEIIEKVGSYVDGELGGSERALVEAHLNLCGPCAEAAMEIREMDLSASRIAVPDVTVEEWRAVWSRVEAGRRGSRIIHVPTKLWRWTALPVAAAVLAGVFLVPWFGPEPPRIEERADLIKPETISGTPPSSIDVIGEEDPASFIQYSDF